MPIILKKIKKTFHTWYAKRLEKRIWLRSFGGSEIIIVNLENECYDCPALRYLVDERSCLINRNLLLYLILATRNALSSEKEENVIVIDDDNDEHSPRRMPPSAPIKQQRIYTSVPKPLVHATSYCLSPSKLLLIGLD